MPRGFKVDYQATFERFDYQWERGLSFVSQPKVSGCGNEYHLILYGKDKAGARAEIFRRNRQANGGVNRCWKCKRIVREARYEGMPGVLVGEWHHLRNKPGQRCDCPENGVVSCGGNCHREEHPQVQFRRRGNEIRHQESLDA